MTGTLTTTRRRNWLADGGIAVSILVWVALVVAPRQLDPLVHENGIVEWFGAAMFGIAAVLFWFAARWSGDPRRYRIASALLGVAAAVLMMEEISWGQQIFHWGTPDAFEANRQGETNLHNLPLWLGGVDVQELFTLAVLGLTVAVPLAARYWGWGRRMIDRLGLPVVSLRVSAWVVGTLVAYRLTRALVHEPYLRGPRETVEAMWAVAIVLVALAAVTGAERRTVTR